MLGSYYKKDEPKEFFDKIKIFHVHGTINKLPWVNNQLQDIRSAFGGPVAGSVSRRVQYQIARNWIFLDEETVNKYVTMANGISLFHEDGDEAMVSEIKTLIKDSYQIFFLGFGFHPDNIKKLITPHPVFKNSSGNRISFFATRYNYSDSEWNQIKDQIKVPFINVGEEKTECYQFLRDTAEYLNKYLFIF